MIKFDKNDNAEFNVLLFYDAASVIKAIGAYDVGKLWCCSLVVVIQKALQASQIC